MLFCILSEIQIIRTGRYLGKRFCKKNLSVPQLYCSFLAAQASKGTLSELFTKPLTQVAARPIVDSLALQTEDSFFSAPTRFGAEKLLSFE